MNVQPELSETGNVKYQSNYEKLRGWIGENFAAVLIIIL
jgi:hypothetical protein